jgi:hypothetical protein
MIQILSNGAFFPSQIQMNLHPKVARALSSAEDGVRGPYGYSLRESIGILVFVDDTSTTNAKLIGDTDRAQLVDPDV